MADAAFEEPRLARMYDALDPDRSDLDVYVRLVEELGASHVLDVGCGTGSFACLLASRGVDVVGVDPAEASLAVARSKPGADAVRWVHGEIGDVGDVVDLVTMTGNVAQVFVADEMWRSVLRTAYDLLRPGGHLVVESRDPNDRAWLRWNRDQTSARVDVPGEGVVTSWVEVTDVSGDLVSFRWTYEFAGDGAVLTSDSTIRFRSREELVDSVVAAGFAVEQVRDAPDRPGRELVVVASRPAGAAGGL